MQPAQQQQRGIAPHAARMRRRHPRAHCSLLMAGAACRRMRRPHMQWWEHRLEHIIISQGVQPCFAVRCVHERGLAVGFPKRGRVFLPTIFSPQRRRSR